MILKDVLDFSSLKLATGCLVVVFMQCIAMGQDNTRNAIRGIVVSESADPIPNARVDISTAAPKSGPSLFCPSCYLDCRKWATTDETGHFEITDLDPQLNFRLVVSAAGYKTIQTKIIVPNQELLELSLNERPHAIDKGRVVQGFVKNETGIAISGALVSPVAVIDEKGLRTFHSKGITPAVSDATGHFEVDLVDGVSGIDIEIAAEGLCNRRFVGLVPRGDQYHFELLEGVHVVGSVESNGRPVQGMTVSVAQTDRRIDGEKFFLSAIPTTTDAQGRFELKNLPPDQEYCVYSVIGEANRTHSATILRTQKFVAPSSGKTVDLACGFGIWACSNQRSMTETSRFHWDQNLRMIRARFQYGSSSGLWACT